LERTKMTNSKEHYYKKKLVLDLVILGIVGLIALIVFWGCGYVYANGLVRNLPEWDEIHLLFGVGSLSGAVAFCVVFCFTVYKLLHYFIAARKTSRSLK
ncbi:MAG: hypothetical protein ACRC2T_06640, partial [Thermoguttaceae bacterium]